MRFELVEGEGHKMITEGSFTICDCCHKDLKFPFYYCRKFNQAFCKECEFGTAKRLCPSLAQIHEHLKIIEVRNEKTK